MKQKINCHLISDSTGETVERVAKASLYQFSNLIPKYFIHNLIRTNDRLNKSLEIIKANPGIVFSTLAQKNQKDALVQICLDTNNNFIDVLSPVVSEISTITGIKDPNYGREKALFGVQYKNDQQYEDKINAIHWSIDHDDGQRLETAVQSDIILMGASRTSKTPTSIYLSLKGYKVANIPLISEIPLNDIIKNDISSPKRKPFYVGLTISPERLTDIRTNRLKQLSNAPFIDIASYADNELVKKEIITFRRLFHQFGIPVIDVTKSGVEEIAAKIIALYQAKLVLA